MQGKTQSNEFLLGWQAYGQAGGQRASGQAGSRTGEQAGWQAVTQAGCGGGPFLTAVAQGDRRSPASWCSWLQGQAAGMGA